MLCVVSTDGAVMVVSVDERLLFDVKGAVALREIVRNLHML